MSVLDRMERDRVAAELAAVERMLAAIPETDFVTRRGFEDRRKTLLQDLEDMPAWTDSSASAALFFGGRPVVASIGIEAGFGGAAIAKFQDLVSKLMVQDDLGRRGPVPQKAASTLHITNIVRGSFGFRIEEVTSQGELVSTSLSNAVGLASNLMLAFCNADDSEFEAAAADHGSRALSTAGEFFTLLNTNGATMRLLTDKLDHSFAPTEITIAAERAATTLVNETVDTFRGRLTGTLPESHTFEFRRDGLGTITGRVDPHLPAAQLAEWNRSYLNSDCTARVRVRHVLRYGAEVKESFTLLGIELPGTAHLLTFSE